MGHIEIYWDILRFIRGILGYAVTALITPRINCITATITVTALMCFWIINAIITFQW